MAVNPVDPDDGAAPAMTVGALRRLRAVNGLKQTHLADLLGVTQATVSRWERGILHMPGAQWARAQRLLAGEPDPAQDAALIRLVETSTARAHLICDRTHRLLAASRTRRAEWRVDPARMIGKPMFGYASTQIRAAEARLDDLGWREGRLSQWTFETDGNSDQMIPIMPGLVRWERIALAHGDARRLVTTLV